MRTYSYKTETCSLLADMETPVSIYLKVRDLYPKSALMESSDFHSAENAHSYICLNPIASIGVNRGVVELRLPDGTVSSEELSEEYTIEVAINQFKQHFNVVGDYSEVCGLYGYTTFNAVQYFEPINVKESCNDMADAPDLLYIVYKQVIVFNHFRNEVVLVEMCQEGECDGLQKLLFNLTNRNISSYSFAREGIVTSTLTDDEHRDNIRKGIVHCLRGDVFQIVLSRRFIQRYSGDDFQVYRALRSINPSPYLFYFDFGGYRIFGSSPETHCKISDGKAYIDPIAGTCKRTGDMIEDKREREKLLSDPKEGAEHVMLVDLARNDLSRNCKEVSVLFFKELQNYSHVMHLVSRVEGVIKDGANSVGTFIDTFPAGTLSGAPKVKAMQLISDLEPHNRGAYGGCIGFIGFGGELNQAITIRTFVSRGNELWLQAGGGIVAKSDVESELQEVNNKLGALNRAIEMAEIIKN